MSVLSSTSTEKGHLRIIFIVPSISTDLEFYKKTFRFGVPLNPLKFTFNIFFFSRLCFSSSLFPHTSITLQALHLHLVLSSGKPNTLISAHFLIGGPLLLPPEPDIPSAIVSHLRRWKHVQGLMQFFCKRWHKRRLKQRYNVRSPSYADSQLKMKVATDYFQWGKNVCTADSPDESLSDDSNLRKNELVNSELSNLISELNLENKLSLNMNLLYDECNTINEMLPLLKEPNSN
ncbi:Integrase catalytic domain-containing protein [Aphis craccivora]|uniref:Integrase catalytic domain-containing protein n=1 Tax=Aphis craccivora TaxID=307492 RepID=A0A6G0YI46_APHCR|nr:Integrase catalytic domain-containing protein [Aphis craccivora]